MGGWREERSPDNLVNGLSVGVRSRYVLLAHTSSARIHLRILPPLLFFSFLPSSLWW